MNMNLMFDKLSMSQWVRYEDTMLIGFNYRRADCSTRGHVSIFALCSGSWTRTLSHAVNIIKSVDINWTLSLPQRRHDVSWIITWNYQGSDIDKYTVIIHHWRWHSNIRSRLLWRKNCLQLTFQTTSFIILFWYLKPIFKWRLFGECKYLNNWIIETNWYTGHFIFLLILSRFVLNKRATSR